MQVILHIGAHFTDDDGLLKSLGKNRTFLAERGVSIPKPRSYRRQIRDVLHDVRSVPLEANARETVLGKMKDPAISEPDRIILSNSNFLGVPRLAVRNDRFYPAAADRLQDFASLFNCDDLEIFIAIRDPATFLPAILTGSPDDTLDEVIEGSNPLSLRWSEMIARIRDAVPNASVTVWCNEDTPLIWEQVMREMAGLEATQSLEGSDDLLSGIMSSEGLARFGEYVVQHPNMTEVQKRRVIAAFMDKFALEDEVEEELDIPGWTEEYIDALTEAYDDDVYEISRMPGVTLISP